MSDRVLEYIKKEVSKEDHGWIRDRVNNARTNILEAFAEKNGLQDSNPQTIINFQIQSEITRRYTFISTYPLDKLLDMARWNGNRASILKVEDTFNVKLDKTMKKRVPQLQELAKINNIEIDF